MNRENLEKLKGYRKMLYVIDMVNGFVNEGTLHDKQLLWNKWHPLFFNN